MEPITLTAIVAPLSQGVAVGIGNVGESALVDAYQGLKTALKRKFGDQSEVVEAVDRLEKRSDSEGRYLGCPALRPTSRYGLCSRTTVTRYPPLTHRNGITSSSPQIHPEFIAICFYVVRRLQGGKHAGCARFRRRRRRYC
jgi:hypothetical protein